MRIGCKCLLRWQLADGGAAELVHTRAVHTRSPVARFHFKQLKDHAMRSMLGCVRIQEKSAEEEKNRRDTYQYYLGVASSSGCALIAGAGATR